MDIEGLAYTQLGKTLHYADQAELFNLRAENDRLRSENERLWAVYKAANKLLNDGCWRGSEGHLQLEQALQTKYNRPEEQVNRDKTPLRAETEQVSQPEKTYQDCVEYAQLPEKGS